MAVATGVGGEEHQYPCHAVCGQHACYIGCPGLTWSVNPGSHIELDNLEEVVDLNECLFTIICGQ